MLNNPNWNKTSRTSDTLLRAADLIEQHGHVKYRMGDRDEGMCANGAIYAAVDGRISEFILGVDVLAESLGCSKGFASSVYTAEWNNKPKRTAQEVIDALRTAAHSSRR